MQPCHKAFKYDGNHAPILTAKGDDELAEEILRIARECEVPIYENPELVKLLARMELGDSIPEELYRTIAEIIAFAWNLKGKFPAGQDPEAVMPEKDITERGDDY
ncbi:MULTISPECIES: EscU/YscU/HrcU family type III secretion system export apparatus switch protein [unclassified Pseudomonas]|uniref:EscU/YscU/HrcU family type III secretion system export apparatus switch protein n=1 Tax=unclassified Pseudomonas TaxID=196821 RepID=UPI002AC96D33|nr:MULTISPECIES: EscU/YscU/HrcU family type III secretion system export apparatus switch protein [unclassified Pseudomonas]MEB0045408.1 EscU/YscU/HrcU family type III secretion system export apparatus switch protein [Pseudomonas sp. Dout3]MEB0097026.1 EscU/YscU/HrcU family type III secretion system export apparatus switch protein [Pseudomonas sp. DC1.2]WPX60540.1 EscU/YscU/HrcU family type III secretion system export apparatus switch protein [Pseudomonas sp. DC1.2]